MGSFGYSRFQGGFSQFQVGFMVFQGSKLIFFIVPGGFLWLFKVPCSFFMVPRFLVGFEGKSWLHVGFYSYRSVFIVRGHFFMDPGGFSCILWIQVCFHDSKWIFTVINGPRLV